jgi:hypothetical protein
MFPGGKIEGFFALYTMFSPGADTSAGYAGGKLVEMGH